MKWWLSKTERKEKLGEVDQRVHILSYKNVSSKDLMYNMVTIVDNTLLYT